MTCTRYTSDFNATRSSPPPHSARRCWLFLTILAVYVSACASAPDTGVRSDFETHQIQTVAIAPFYTSASFGLDNDQRAELAASYESFAEQALRHQGFEVLDSPAFRSHLTDQGHWQTFDDGIRLRQALQSYFEPSTEGGSPSIEVRTLIDLATQGAFPVETILFGEVIYHTEGTCRGRADHYTPYARINLAPSAPSELPRPCVTSHFQAKLVDVQTGHTMWFNRIFIETHTRHLDADVADATIAESVRTALTADGGLTPLAPRPTGDDAQIGAR